MKRTPTTLALAAVATLLLAAPASAQEDACSQSDPCTWVLGVDAGGFDRADGSERNATVGDWYVLDVFNFDEVEHTITLESHAVSLVVPAVDGAVSAAFELATVGAYALEDAPGGDVLYVNVLATDAVDEETGTEPDAVPKQHDEPDAGAPLGLPVALAAVAAALVARRR